MTASASIGREEVWRPVALFAGQACKFHNHGVRVFKFVSGTVKVA